MSDRTLRARLALDIRDQELAKEHAEKLAQMGFHVTGTAARGVSFEGTIELFEKIFNSKVNLFNSTVGFLTEPLLPEPINRHVSSVYFPTSPIYA